MYAFFRLIHVWMSENESYFTVYILALFVSCVLQLIHADKPISTDEITEMIYYLTHNYARASRSVSIPAPIYYAHLAAFR